MVKAYKIGTLWSGDLYNRYDVLRIYLEYGGDNKEWIIPLDLVQKGNIVKLEPTEEKVINVETDIDKEELPSIKDERKDKEEQVVYLCNGCLLDNKCYPYGFRKDGEFCSDKKEEFVLQLKEEVMCENNFECNSNVCVSGKCVSEGLIEKILNWFKKLFD